MANGTGNGTGEVVEPAGVMADVQRAIALALIGTLAIVTLILTIRLVIWGDASALLDMSKTLQAAMVNMALIALGFFFGSSRSKEQTDAGQQKIVDKLTSNAPPAVGPVAPVPSPVVVVAWWSLLTDDEKTALAAAAPTDARVAAFIKAAEIGKAVPDDLTYLAGKGLLTQDRATQLKDA